MKKTQYNIKTADDILSLKDCDIIIETLNNAPTDPPVFFIKIDNKNIDVSFGFDLEDFVKMNRFLKRAVNKTTSIN